MLTFMPALYNTKKSLSGLWYSIRLAGAHSFKAKIGFEKYAPGPKILTKTSEKITVWFGALDIGTFWLISQV